MNKWDCLWSGAGIACWYPSAGRNVNAIRYWELGIGNALQPDLFVFSDIEYSGALPCSVSELSQMLHLDEVDISYEQFEVVMKARFKFKDFSQYYDVQAIDPELLELLNVGLVEEHLIEDMYPGLYEKRVFCIKLVCGIKTVLFMACSNEDFYRYAVSQKLSVGAIMLYRHMDDFIYREESTIISSLGIRESLGSPAYQVFHGEHLIQSAYTWESNYNMNGSDVVSFISYPDWAISNA